MSLWATQTLLLPLNFPQDFLPERSLLSRLLTFASQNGRGDKRAISAATDIPTGESTGKVEPMIHYACGMGLVQAEKHGAEWQLQLTALGRVIKAEDPYLSESVTQWVLHLLLCRRSGLSEPARGIADAWFALFAEGGLRLGQIFERTAYEHSLEERHGAKSYLKSLSGLVPRSYLEPTCFGAIRALSAEPKDVYIRHPAPADTGHFPAYAAYLCVVWDRLYPEQSQLAIDELLAANRCLEVLGWNQATASRWLDWMADQGLLQLDRQTGNTLALRLQETDTVIQCLFAGLI